MGIEGTEIRSGQFGDPAEIRDYRVQSLGDVLVERVVWGDLASRHWLADAVVADVGYIWFRFWLLRHEQVVERYYTPDATLIGTQIDVCMPLVCDAIGCRAADLILDIWIDPRGQVTVHNEEGFDAAVASGRLSDDQRRHAETHLRALTAAIARGKFPPPLVRNWQLDPKRINV
jgi:predicted RNA-binding protein associated with RNAse of E/G family